MAEWMLLECFNELGDPFACLTENPASVFSPLVIATGFNETLERVEFQVDDVWSAQGSLFASKPFFLVDEQKFPVPVPHPMEGCLGEIEELFTIALAVIQRRRSIAAT
ncbi:hypothetical protein [Roseiconus nitratireducens]|uniref:hypothetical protein n=1 Tax=Roseiconus nitratireducens TaxID=2605748 RepID=UPI0013757657|nr:hypothetical protein [Roseiconus nitratireducens]